MAELFWWKWKPSPFPTFSPTQLEFLCRSRLWQTHFIAVETGTSELAGLQCHFCNLRTPRRRGSRETWLKRRFLLSPKLQKSGWGEGRARASVSLTSFPCNADAKWCLRTEAPMSETNRKGPSFPTPSPGSHACRQELTDSQVQEVACFNHTQRAGRGGMLEDPIPSIYPPVQSPGAETHSGQVKKPQAECTDRHEVTKISLD